jgi:hypothetical protein
LVLFLFGFLIIYQDLPPREKMITPRTIRTIPNIFFVVIFSPK